MNYLVSESQISKKIINEKKEYIQNYFLNLLRVPEGFSKIELNETVSQQVQTIPWDSLNYDRCVCHFVSAHTFDDGSQTYWGYVLLDVSTERWEEQKSLVFIKFVYFPTENDRILLDEISWTDDGFSKEIWSYDTDTLEDSNHSSAVRLLDHEIEIYPYDKEEPQTNLKDEDLEQYIGKIFLDICRFPEHIEKYKKILTPESIKLLESVEWYYYYPEQFYDAAWGIDDEMYCVASQFSPAVWGVGYVAEPIITCQYEPETGKIKILEFDMRKWWYR